MAVVTSLLVCFQIDNAKMFLSNMRVKGMVLCSWLELRCFSGLVMFLFGLDHNETESKNDEKKFK